MKNRIIGVCVLVFLIFFTVAVLYSYAGEERITLTTYYPAPYGVYREMRANGLAVGSDYRHEPADLANGLLIVEDRVGIGTREPHESLTVVGSNNINPVFPDGLEGEVQQGNICSYEVPIGKTLYITTAYNRSVDRNYILLNNVPFFLFRIELSRAFSSPLVVAGGTRISCSGEANIYTNGILTDSKTTIVNITLGSFTVPEDKILFILTAHYDIQDSTSLILSDNEPIYMMINCHSIPFQTPLVVAGGKTVSSSNDVINITGYLRPRNLN